MGMRDIMARLREEDPDFARWIGRIRFWTTAIAVVAGLALIAAVGSNVWNFGQDKNITNVHNEVTRLQKTPCSRNPIHPNRRCEHDRQSLARGESIVSACISHQRVTGTKGRNCERLYVDVANRGAPEPASVALPRGGDATSSPSTGTSQPGRHQGGSGTGTDRPSHPHAPSVPHQSPPKVPAEPGGGIEEVPSSPPPSSSERSSGISTSTTERSTEVVDEPSPPPGTPAPEPSAAPVREAVGGVVEGVGHTVEEAGSTVDEVVGGVGCGLTGALGGPCR